MKRVVNSSIAFVMMFAMLLTSGIVANASELQGNTEYRSVLESITDKQAVDNVNSVEKLDTTDTIKNVDSDFKSCRLIITNKEDMEFEDKDNTIKTVQHIDNIYIVEYFTVEATEQAYNDYLSNGYEVELDTVKDAPEGVSNKDKLDNDINKDEIATTNEKKDVEKLDKINKDKDKKKEEDKKETITVAVLDTGLNVGEDIFTDRLVEGKNFVDEDSDTTDDVNGHGTTMARLILDTVNDVNQENNIKIMPIKILNDDGKGTTLSAYKGIKYLIEEKQKNPDFNVVINISATGVGQSKLLNSVINEAYNNAIPIVVSAGNDNKDIFDYTPANVKSAFTISSAYEYEDEYYKSIYSNYGNGIDYCTSGDYEYTRIIDEKEVVTKVMGTSVSSAYATSYIALLKQMAMSDEDDDNDELSITDIDNSLYLSAIALDDNKDHFGKGYLLKENIVLDHKRIKDKELDVDNVAEVSENIELGTAYSKVSNRALYVRNLPAGGNWYVMMYLNDDDTHNTFSWTDWVTATSKGQALRVPDGGQISIKRADDTTVSIFYDDCDISNVTPWIQIGTANGDYYKITGIGRDNSIAGYWNSAQTQTAEEHYKPDEWHYDENGANVDVYCGIGAKDFDMQWSEESQVWWGSASVDDFVVYWQPTGFKVHYVTWGGAWDNGSTDMMSVDYNRHGTNVFGLGIGAKGPRKDGYIFKGWYFSNMNGFEPQHGSTHTVTNLIDYANRHTSVRDAYGYNLNLLNAHIWNNADFDIATYNRSYADCNPMDGTYPNPLGDFDDFKQLLPSDIYTACDDMFAGEEIVAHAVWEKVPGFEVTWDTNGGKWTDGSTNDITFQYSPEGINRLIPSYAVGIDPNSAPTKDGKKFKGWYFAYDDGTQRKDPRVTDMIDYYHRNADLQQEGVGKAFGMLSMNGLWRHWCDFGQGEHRQIADHATNVKDLSNNYDNGNQLLLNGEYFCNTYVEGSYDLKNAKLRAYAIYEDADYPIKYIMNGGTNNPKNPTAYSKNEVIHIYRPDSWVDKKTGTVKVFDYWTCDKAVDVWIFHCEPNTRLGEAGDVLDINAGDYGPLTFTAHWKEGYEIKYNMNGAPDSANDSRNPHSYEADKEVITIYNAHDWEDDYFTYTFNGWKCNKAIDVWLVHINANTHIPLEWIDNGILNINAGNYGNMKFTAQWVKHPKHEEDLGWNYKLIWDSNGNWNDGRNDTETIKYSHSYSNKYHYYTEETDEDGNTHKKWHTETTPYKGELATYEVPSTPRTATLYFDDPNGHGNTQDIASPIKTQKRFDGWKKIKTTGTRTSTKTIWSNSEGEYEKEYHKSNYRADSPWKSPGKFRDLVDAGKTATLQAQWTRLPNTLPSVSKPGYDFLGWQINGTGKIYRAGEQYTVGKDDNDVKFVAVWRRNQGKVVYNPNGAVNDNNQQYSPVTDNSYTMLNGSYTTKDGDIFGKEVTEDGFIKNETTKNKVGTTITNKYILNDGDIINTLGTTDKLSTFQGWSSINYARHDTPNILYNGYVTKFMNIYYDVTAVNKLKIANAPNPYTINNVITRANQIVAHRNNNISKWKATPKLSEIGDWFEKLTTSKLYYDPSLEGNGIVDMYATWDEFPAFIEVDDVTILSSDLEKKNFFETDAQIQQRIETRIMRDMIVTDKEQENYGRLPYGQLDKLTGDDKGKGKVGIEVVDLDLDAMREIGTGMTGGILVTIQATDSAGHITKTQIIIHPVPLSYIKAHITIFLRFRIEFKAQK